MKKRILLIIVICLVIIGIILAIVFIGPAGCPGRPGRPGREGAPLDTVVVTRGSVTRTVSVDGNLEMPSKAYLSFGVTGTVADVLLAKGDNVEKDQIERGYEVK